MKTVHRDLNTTKMDIVSDLNEIHVLHDFLLNKLSKVLMTGTQCIIYNMAFTNSTCLNNKT